MNENRHERRYHGGYDSWQAKVIMAPIMAVVAVSDAIKSGIKMIKGKTKK